MPKNLAENMASERPICECGRKFEKHVPSDGPMPCWECDPICIGYRPAPAATTPERDAVDIAGRIKALPEVKHGYFVWQAPNEELEGGFRPEDLKILADAYLAARRADPTPDYPPYEGAVPLKCCVWKRESTQEWVLEIEGIINDTDGNWRHTQPLTVPIEEVPGLPTHYRDEPAAATDGTLEGRIMRRIRDSLWYIDDYAKNGKAGELPESVAFDNIGMHSRRIAEVLTALEGEAETARRADPPPDVIRRIEGSLYDRAGWKSRDEALAEAYSEFGLSVPKNLGTAVILERVWKAGVRAGAALVGAIDTETKEVE
jgi:hypothetical protein